MRWFYLTVIILFSAATLLFVLQNFDVVTMSILGFSVRAPLGILIAVVYLVGGVNGRKPVCAITSILHRLATQLNASLT